MNNVDWINKAIFYHIYPLGFCGAPLINTNTSIKYRINKLVDWIPHLKELSVNALYLGPVFSSTVHGYDTNDFRMIDSRLGDNDSFKKVCNALHENGIKIVLDAVFNHVGRDFWAFKDVIKNQVDSKYGEWFHIDFRGANSYGDGFSYKSWEGHMSLVKLNLSNPEVVEYLLGSVRLWIEEFGIEGLRLDAADQVDLDFFRRLHKYVKTINPNFWLMGEIIHGDYRKWANPDTLDSVTNYECYKGLHSSHNDKNYYEIAHSFNRQFGMEAIYKDLVLYNFLDNHDVNRIATTLKNPEHIYNIYTMMYSMPGVPSIYYGSEWGIQGARDSSSDNALRPCVDLNNVPNPNNKLLEHIVNLGEIRSKLPALQYGRLQNIIIQNEHFLFKRYLDNQTVYSAFNLSSNSVKITFNINGNNVTDMLTGKEYKGSKSEVQIEIPPYTSMILIEGDSTNAATEPPKQLTTEKGVVVGGTYHHFKGGDYIVLAVARHSETLEEMVVYKEINGQQNTWIRPIKMFTEDVNDFGNIKRRFYYVSND